MQTNKENVHQEIMRICLSQNKVPFQNFYFPEKIAQFQSNLRFQIWLFGTWYFFLQQLAASQKPCLNMSQILNVLQLQQYFTLSLLIDIFSFTIPFLLWHSTQRLTMLYVHCSELTVSLTLHLSRKNVDIQYLGIKIILPNCNLVQNF